MKKIVAFDSLRFIACIFIILHHTGINIYGFHEMSWSYFRTGGLAVEIFFVLSGFLLANSYYKSLSNNLSIADNCKKYFFDRIKRLYPEYIFAMLLCSLLTNLFSHHLSMKTFMLNAVMMAGWGGIPNIINGIWYVIVLFWGGCFLFNILSIYKEKAVYWMLPTISFLCLFYLINHGGTISGHQWGIEFNLLSKGTIRGLLCITVGIYCFQICQRMKTANMYLKPKIQNTLLFILEVVAVVLLVNAVLIRKNQDVSDFNIYFYISYIVGLLYFRKEKFLKFLSWKGWKPFTDLSYTIYLTHLILLEILRVHWVGLSTMNPYLMYTIVTILCIAFGAICYHTQKRLFAKLKHILFVSPSGQYLESLKNLRERERTLAESNNKTEL